jgi:hypothetical protein
VYTDFNRTVTPALNPYATSKNSYKIFKF